MIVNGINITGLYKFKTGVQFKYQDLIYYDGNLFIVLSDYLSSEFDTPDNSRKCRLYIDYIYSNGYIKDPENELVTANQVSGLLNNFILGLNAGGSISPILLNSLTELDDYRKTAVHHLTINDEHYLLRIYQLSNDDGVKVVQELVDYLTPRIKYRVFDVNDPEPSHGFRILQTLKNDSELQSLLDDIYKEHARSVDALEKYTKNQRYRSYIEVNPDKDKTYWISNTNNSEDILIKLLVTYKDSSGFTHQDSISIDPNGIDETVICNDYKVGLIQQTAGISKGYKVSVELIGNHGITGLSVLRFLFLYKNN